MVPIGVVGAVLAVLCAVVAAVAIVRGSGGLSGGAVGVWIPFALLSSTAGFASQWMPLIASGAALVAFLVIGFALRAILTLAAPRRPRPRPTPSTSSAAPASAAPAPALAS